MSRHLLQALYEALNTESPLHKTHTNTHGFLRMTQPLVCTYLAIWWQVLLHKSILIPAKENTNVTWHFQCSTCWDHFCRLKDAANSVTATLAVPWLMMGQPAVMLTVTSYAAAGKPHRIYVLALCNAVNLMFSVWANSSIWSYLHGLHIARNETRTETSLIQT